MNKTLRILVVEDEVLVAFSLKVELTRAGYKVCGVAATADEAVSLALQHRPDVILMDIGLKGEKDGFDAAGAIYAVEFIPIVFVSGYLDDANRARAAQFNPLACLGKPATLMQIKNSFAALAK